MLRKEELSSRPPSAKKPEAALPEIWYFPALAYFPPVVETHFRSNALETLSLDT